MPDTPVSYIVVVVVGGAQIVLLFERIFETINFDFATNLAEYVQNRIRSKNKENNLIKSTRAPVCICMCVSNISRTDHGQKYQNV